MTIPDRDSLPNEFLRGIFDDSHISKYGISASLFKEFKNNKDRERPFDELSINWHDNEQALNLLLYAEIDGIYIYKEGVGVFDTDELVKMCKKERIINSLYYERDRLDDNPYHGNLLLIKGIDKKERDTIASTILLNCYLDIKQRES